MPIKFLLRSVIPLSILMFLSLKSAAQQTGFACIYSKNLCGGKTASGEKFDCDKLTAAHLKLKMGAKIQVTNLENGKTVVVKSMTEDLIPKNTSSICRPLPLKKLD